MCVSLPVKRGAADVLKCWRTVWHHSARLLAAIIFWSYIVTAAAEDSVATSASAESSGNGEAAVNVSVFYLTNRQRYDGKPVADTYSGDRGASHFGRCEVEFTPIPIVNELASRLSFYVMSETKVVTLAERAEPSVFCRQVPRPDRCPRHPEA